MRTKKGDKRMNKILAVTLVAGFAISAQAAVENANQATTSISTETVSVQEVAPVATEKKWSGVFASENYTGLKNNSDTDITADEKVEVKYKLSDRDTVSLAQEWSRNYGRGDNEAHNKIADTSIRYTRSGYKLPADVAYGVQGRVYLPISDASKDSGQITQIRVYNTFSKEVAKNLTAGLLINPRIFVQDGSGADDAGVNKFRLLNSASLTYAISEKVSVETTVGVYMKWKNGRERADNLDASTSVYYSPLSWLDLNVGVRQTDDASDLRDSGAKIYAAEQSEYYLLATFKM